MLPVFLNFRKECQASGDLQEILIGIEIKKLLAQSMMPER